MELSSSGLVWPSILEPRADHIRMISLINQRTRLEKVLVRLHRITSSYGGWRPLVEQLLSALCEISGTSFCIAFDNPFGQAHRYQNAKDLLIGTALTLIGVPKPKPISIVIPGHCDEIKNLFFPHLGIVLKTHRGPLLVRETNQIIEATWPDGESVTIPIGGIRDQQIHLSRANTVPRLDDIMVLNDLAGLPRDRLRLRNTSYAHISMLNEGLSLLRDVWPEAYDECRRTYRGVVFLRHTQCMTYSFTDSDFPRLFLASARDPVQVADALVHECAHARLASILQLDSIVVDDNRPKYRSPWRKDDRPLLGVLQGIHAFVNVCEFYKRMNLQGPKYDRRNSEILTRQKLNVRTAWREIGTKIRPTDIGSSFVKELASATEAL